VPKRPCRWCRRRALTWLGHEVERRPVARPDDREVPTVESRDRVKAEAFGDGHETGVNASEWLIGVLLSQRSDAMPVSATT